MLTSYWTAKLWRFKLLRDTRSKSTIFIFPTPDRANILTAWDPTPPTPNTITDDYYNFLNFYSPKNLIILANCSFFSYWYYLQLKSWIFSFFYFIYYFLLLLRLYFDKQKPVISEPIARPPINVAIYDF